MKNKLLTTIAYLVSSSLGILLAFWLTSSLILPSKSQTQQPSGALPAEQVLVVSPPPVQPQVPPSTQQAPPPVQPQLPPPVQPQVQAPPSAQPQLPPPVQPQLPPPVQPQVQAQQPAQPQAQPQVPPAGQAPPPAPGQPPAPGTNVQGQQQNLISADIETLMAPYNYDSENRRDPFKPFTVDISADVVSEEGFFVGPVRPLQRFELENIIPVAIIWDVESPKAMFVDPTNEVHILGKDERIGRNNGYIAAIREGEVVVIETVKRKGQLSFKTSILKLGGRKDN